jgi:GH15 family glucan-1,4-alpha-glucosidase
MADSIREKLWCPGVGGILRYQGDTYRGGNPWVLATLWLGAVDLALGNIAGARECYAWAEAKTTELGMMPEQVHRESGLPCWVIPLGWSHAMMLLFAREVVRRGKQKEIWGA